MKQKELTKSFMMILNIENSLVSLFVKTDYSALRVKGQVIGRVATERKKQE